MSHAESECPNSARLLGSHSCGATSLPKKQGLLAGFLQIGIQLKRILSTECPKDYYTERSERWSVEIRFLKSAGSTLILWTFFGHFGLRIHRWRFVECCPAQVPTFNSRQSSQQITHSNESRCDTRTNVIHIYT